MTESTPLDAEIGEIAPALEVHTSIHTDGDGLGRLTDLVDAARDPYDLGYGRQAFVVPDGHDVRVVETEVFQYAPDARRGTVRVTTPRSLATYVNRHGDARTTLWADKAAATRDRGAMPSVIAVIDDDDAEGTPAWREHRAILDLRYSQAWLDWTGVSGRAMGQVQFAEFIEDHLGDIVAPAPADMLDLAQTFEATKSVDFEQSNRLSSSERRLVYKETVQARAGQKGDVLVPEFITLNLSPFEGVDPVQVQARFRYRIAGGDLSLTVVLDRPDNVIDRTFEVILDDLGDWTARPAEGDESMLGLSDGEAPPPVRLDVMFGNPGNARR